MIFIYAFLFIISASIIGFCLTYLDTKHNKKESLRTLKLMFLIGVCSLILYRLLYIAILMIN